MSIQRPSEREPRSSALAMFTDSEELMSAFQRNLEHGRPRCLVLVYYSDAGLARPLVQVMGST